MSIKDSLRKYTKYNWFEKIWLISQWINTKRLALRYSDYEYAVLLYKRHTGHLPDFKNPKTMDEKVWLLKLCNRDQLLTLCSDKHLAREYVASCGYEHILKHEYACYRNADEIDFDDLPDVCYLKCNHASGMNLIYRKGDKYDLDHIRWKFNFLLKQQPYYLSREWNYKNIPRRIVCEEVLEMPDRISDIPELQFFCFGGKPLFLIYNLGLADKNGVHKDPTRWALWTDWSIVKEASKLNYNNKLPVKPINYEEMIKCAQILSKPFPYVRVDLFNIDGSIYFNEFTFYSGGGFTLSKTDVIQKIGGENIDLTGFSISEDAMRHRTLEDVKNGM